MRLASLSGVSALLGSAALLLTGSGLQGTLLSYRAALEGWGDGTIALLMSSYFGGFLAGCWAAPYVVRRVGHIRAFAVFAAIAGSAALLHSLLVSPGVWALLRLVSGVCFAGLYMIIESWLNEKTANAERARVISVYRLVDIGASTLGQFLLAANEPRTALPFAMLTILICLSLVPVSLTQTVAPPVPRTAQLRVGNLFRVSPLAIVACFGLGAANGAFWALAPASLAAAGQPTTFVASFMAAALIGGALLQWPVGRISDFLDRRTVLAAGLFAAAIGGFALAFAQDAGNQALLAAAAAFGAAMFPLYSICVAHANDFATPDAFLEVSSGLLLANAAGSVLGPLAAAALTAALGARALFAFIGAVLLLLGLYALYRMTRRPTTAVELHNDFVPVPRTTPNVFTLDPRQEAEDAPAR
jgi:MFS family permease